jgi:hypothetical protein
MVWRKVRKIIRSTVAGNKNERINKSSTPLQNVIHRLGTKLVVLLNPGF